MRGAIVIPAFNEEKSLGDVLDRLAGLCLSAEMVVIDDGSWDGTATLARAQGATVILHLINLGYARAVQTGIRYALRKGLDYCVTFDADGQHDPSSVAQLLGRAQASDRPDIVIGSRFIQTRRYCGPLGRRLGMGLFSVLTRSIGGHRIYDTTSGLRWMSRTALPAVAGLSTVDLHSELIIYSLLRGLHVVEVPVVMRDRMSGKSMYNSIAGFAYPLKTLLSILVLFVQARREGRIAHA